MRLRQSIIPCPSVIVMGGRFNLFKVAQADRRPFCFLLFFLIYVLFIFSFEMCVEYIMPKPQAYRHENLAIGYDRHD
jgi:hypothetical protein